jgi:hypothetical protein
MRRCSLFTLIAALSTTAWGQTIDHRHVDQAASIPQPVMDAIGKQRWFFTHASLGQNCLLNKGIDGLHQEDSSRYKLVRVQVEPAFSPEPNPPPSSSADGTIYHWPRGQTDWRGKLDMLDKAIRDKGWRSPAVNIVMDKLCFIDYQAQAMAYLDRMAALERDYPDTVFVYTTIPLLRTDRDDRPEWRDCNVLTNNFNKAMREYCASHNKILLDIADIEAHAPDGKEHTFMHGGETYQALLPEYAQGTSNYLNDVGSRRVALAWYATAGGLVLKANPFKIKGIVEPEQGVVQLTWACDLDATYIVWSCPELGSALWNQVGTLPARSGTSTWEDAAAIVSRRFYRIELR